VERFDDEARPYQSRTPASVSRMSAAQDLGDYTLQSNLFSARAKPGHHARLEGLSKRAIT
jgi:hypothetical protein